MGALGGEMNQAVLSHCVKRRCLEERKVFLRKRRKLVTGLRAEHKFAELEFLPAYQLSPNFPLMTLTDIVTGPHHPGNRH